MPVSYEELIEIIHKEIRTKPVLLQLFDIRTGILLAEFNMN